MQKNLFKDFQKEVIRVLTLFVFLFLLPIVSYGATLFVSPSSGNYNLGDRIVFRIFVSSDKPFNAVSGSVQFSTSHFTIESVSKSGSALNFWVTEPVFSNNSGIVNFEGVALGGFNGETGSVVNVTARTKSEGVANVQFLSGQVLANDGQGTDITDGFSGSSINILPAEAVVPQRPSEIKEEPIQEIISKPSIVPVSSPQIRYGKRYGEPAIIGESNYPNAQILLTFISESGSKIFITEKSDNFGAFFAMIPNILRSGTYQVSAVAILDDLSSSEPSNEIRVVAGNVIRDVDWRIWIAFLIILLLVILILLKYFREKIKKFFPKLKKETDEVEKAVDDPFDILREDIEDALNAKKNSKSESQSIERLKTDLRKTERAIKDEIDDIKSL